jgi:choice-of-anchor B domain-containing protein
MRPSGTLLVTIGVLLLAGGVRAQSPPENVVLLSHLDRGESYSGNWGYTSPGGVELAISGTRTGTSFIDATDPSNAYELTFIPGPNSGWREMATYGEYCYIVTEAEGASLQIVSLTDPLSPTLARTLNPPELPYTTAHEIKADPETGLLYVCGTNDGVSQTGLIILDLNADPLNPTLRGTWTDYYAHDLSLLDGKAYVAAISNDLIVVLDVSQPGTPPIIGEWTYPSPIAPHNTWPTADGSFLVTTDETSGGHLRMWDIRNLAQPVQTGEWISPNGAVVHNAYLRGNLCYMSHYADGLRVVDVSDPFNLVPVGWYDMNSPGAWGCWCFAADPTIAYITDIGSGTYILRYIPESSGVPGPPAGSPTRPVLLGNFPNPFHPATTIGLRLVEPGPVTLRIYDASGRLTRTLVDRVLAAGEQSVIWDGRDDAQTRAASGVYYYRLEAPGLAESRSMLLAR